MPKNARTLDQWRGQYDKSVIIPATIRNALAAMLKEGPENWESEEEFRKRAGLSPADMAEYRELFAAHIVVSPGQRGRPSKRIWFADAKVAKKVRGE